MLLKITVYSILASIILFLLSPLVDVFKNQVTVYPISKDDKGKEISLNRSIYKINTDSQTVIFWSPGIYEVPTKLANCSVRDRLHWQCNYSDGSGTLIMNNNKFEILSNSDLPEQDIQYVSRFKWWTALFRN
jgi:hypothetical protein